MAESSLSQYIAQHCPFAKIESESESQMIVSCRIHAKPGSKKERIQKNGDELIVAVNARPVEGEANQRIVQLLSKFFSIAKRQVEIDFGDRGKQKRILMCFFFSKDRDINYYLNIWKNLE
ncbi:MAG: hypothetical protein Fur0010_07610 [Bdellovibrio sp.]